MLSIFISLLYMFQATMCPSSGEITVSMCGVCSAGFSSLHVSGNHVPIIRRNYCIYVWRLVCWFLFSTCFGQPCAHHQEKLLYLCVASGLLVSLLYMFRATMCPSSGEITVSMRHWYFSLCMSGDWSAGWSETPTSRPDATHRYSNFSL